MLDNKPRDYGYIQHKDRYPLELSGTMKRKCPPSVSKQQAANTVSFGVRDRGKFINQFLDNYKDLKSVLPVDLQPSRKTISKKMCHKENYYGLSGAPYLMIKSNTKSDHPERRHIEENLHGSDRKEPERKHFQTRFGKQSQKQWACPRPHTSTLQHKIHQDLYSNANRRERAFSSTVRMSKKTMFSEGCNLGYEKQKNRKVSCSKHQELMGSYCQPLNNFQCKNIRDDWRKSSFVLG